MKALIVRYIGLTVAPPVRGEQGTVISTRLGHPGTHHQQLIYNVNWDEAGPWEVWEAELEVLA